MGWTKHPDAVQAIQGARREALSCVRKVAQRLRQELKSPDDPNGSTVLELGGALHYELRRFASARRAVGGDEDVDLQNYIGLLLEVFPAFKWSVHVR